MRRDQPRNGDLNRTRHEERSPCPPITPSHPRGPVPLDPARLCREFGRRRHRAHGGRGAGHGRGEFRPRARLFRRAEDLYRPVEPAPLDQRPPDGRVLPAGRPRDQARVPRRPALHLAAPHPAGRRRGGGMAVPALFFVAFNLATPETMRGWAIRRPPTSPSPSACWRCSATGAGLAQDLPHRARHHRRSRRGHDHRRLLHGQSLHGLACRRHRRSRHPRGAEPHECALPPALPAARRRPLGCWC